MEIKALVGLTETFHWLWQHHLGDWKKIFLSDENFRIVGRSIDLGDD